MNMDNWNKMLALLEQAATIAVDNDISAEQFRKLSEQKFHMVEYAFGPGI